MKRFILICGFGMLMVLALGCNQNPKWNFNIDTRRITIETEPAGANVTQINFQGTPPTNLGTTPLENTPVVVITKLKKAKNLSYSQVEDLMRRVGTVFVRIEKPGYQTYSAPLSTEAGRTVSYKIILEKLKNDPNMRQQPTYLTGQDMEK